MGISPDGSNFTPMFGVVIEISCNLQAWILLHNCWYFFSHTTGKYNYNVFIQIKIRAEHQGMIAMLMLGTWSEAEG